MSEFKWIDNDDELNLMPSQRGHTYGEGDMLVGKFTRNEREFHAVCSFQRHHGCSAFYDRRDNPVDGTMLAWRYATDADIAADAADYAEDGS